MSATDTPIYAPEPTEQTKRYAALAGAKHFGTESIQIVPAAVEDSAHCVFVFRVDGWNPKGWQILGPCVFVTVSDDGVAIVEED